jgi:hypothetical protein
MGQRVLRIEGLPDGALDAAAAFHAEWLEKARGIPPRNGEDLVLVFPPAPYDHRGWRLAAVQDLARAAAPMRVNGVVGDDEEAIAEAVAWLENAPGITGQLLELAAD